MNTLVTLKIKRDTLQKIKVISSLEGQTMIDWLGWIADKAYESKIKSNRKHLK